MEKLIWCTCTHIFNTKINLLHLFHENYLLECQEHLSFKHISHPFEIFALVQDICCNMGESGLTPLTIVQWFTWGVSVGYEWLPTVVPLGNTVVPLKNIVDSTWVSQELQHHPPLSWNVAQEPCCSGFITTFLYH